MGIQRVSGSVWDTSDNLVVRILADLPQVDREGIIFVSGGTTPNDGNGGWYMYDTRMSRSKANGTSIVDPTGAGTGSGCWVKQNYFTSPAGSSFSEVQTASAGQVEFTLQTFTYNPGNGEVSVYVNGSRLTSKSYSETDVNKITLIGRGLRLGDVVEVIKYDQPVGQQRPAIVALTVGFGNKADGRPTNLTKQNVQEAIEELESIVAVAAGGAIPTASNIAYISTAPDTSPNVQTALAALDQRLRAHIPFNRTAHGADEITWNDTIAKFGVSDVQAAIEELFHRIGHGAARDITFDPLPIADSAISATNLQALGEQLFTYAKGTNDELKAHEQVQHGAHDSEAIDFDGDNSGHAFLQGANNVDLVLRALAHEVENPSIPASGIAVDDSQYPALGKNAQEALEKAWLRDDQHIHDNTAHAATSITFKASLRGLVSGKLQARVLAANVQNAVDALEEVIVDHQRSTTAHDAGNLTFTPQMGIQANTVEQAILFANSGNWQYQGHLDLTAPPPAMVPTANHFWTVPYTGNVDPGWTPLFDTNGRLPAAVAGDGYVFADGSRYWYMAMPVLGNAVVTNPIAGQSQSITPADPADAALILNAAPGQSAVLFTVKGKVRIMDHLRVKDASDDNGPLRQNAAQVLFDPTTSALQSNTVQAALKEMDDDLEGHVNGLTRPHPASAIVFTPITDVTAHDVQAAITFVQNNLEAHRSARAAHAAINLSYNNKSSGLTAQTIQAAIDELNAGALNHPNQATDAHQATAIGFKATPDVAENNVQRAIESVDTAWRGHQSATNGAHAATAVAAIPPTGYTFSNVQTGLDAALKAVGDHLGQAVAAHAASAVSFDNTGTGLTAGDMQQALVELSGKITEDLDGGVY